VSAIRRRYLAEIGIAVGVFFGGPIADMLGTKITLMGFAVSVFVVVIAFVFGPRIAAARRNIS
jgi:hypothetical protein